MQKYFLKEYNFGITFQFILRQYNTRTFHYNFQSCLRGSLYKKQNIFSFQTKMKYNIIYRNQ